jgi:hypothetical protein
LLSAFRYGISRPSMPSGMNRRIPQMHDQAIPGRFSVKTAVRPGTGADRSPIRHSGRRAVGVRRRRPDAGAYRWLTRLPAGPKGRPPRQPRRQPRWPRRSIHGSNGRQVGRRSSRDGSARRGSPRPGDAVTAGDDRARRDNRRRAELPRVGCELGCGQEGPRSTIQAGAQLLHDHRQSLVVSGRGHRALDCQTDHELTVGSR